MVEAFIFQETKNLPMSFNSQEWEAEDSPMGKISLNKLQIIRQANLQLSHFLFHLHCQKILFFSELSDFWENWYFYTYIFTFIKIKHTHILKRTINFPKRETRISKNKNLKLQYLALALTEPKFQKVLNLTMRTKYVCSLYITVF